MTERISSIGRAPVDRRIHSHTTEVDSELSEFWLAVRRQMWLVALCAFAGLILGLLLYATTPKQYYAGATVLIEERQNDLEQEITTSLPLLRDETGVQNEIQILSSLYLASEVVHALDLQANEEFLSPETSLAGRMKSRAVKWLGALLPTDTELEPGPALTAEEIAERQVLDAAMALRRNTEFTRIGRSFSVEIGYTSNDPALSAAIANAYADAYLADGMQANLEASERKADWMRERIEELRLAALEAAEEAERFRAEHGAIDQQGLIERDQRAEALNELFLTIQSRYQQIAMEGSFPVTNGRILSRAITPKQPAQPKAWQLLGVGMVAGMMLGLALAVLREWREIGFRTADDVRAVAGVSFLGYLPTIYRRDLRHKKTVGRRETKQVAETGFASARRASAGGADAPLVLAGPIATPTAAAVPVPYGAVPPELFVSTFGLGSAADTALRNILASVDLDFEGKTGRVVAVGAVMQGEGATTVAGNLANLSARSGMRTLLIDGDFKRSTLSRRLGTADDPGILGILDGEVTIANAIGRLPHTGLNFLPTGAVARHEDALDPRIPGELADLIASVRQSYDYVFIDLPPLGLSSDAKMLVRSLDRMVLVTRWGQTPRRLVMAFLEQEPEIRRKTLGMILNQTLTRRLPKYGVPLGRHGALA